MESVEKNYSEEEKDKILASFKSRLVKSPFNSESIQNELELMSKECDTTVANLFLLAETDQLPGAISDKAMSLFSIAKTLKN